jgi:hypothetical protein
MKKENITGYYLPSIFLIIGIVTSLYSSELKTIITKINFMNIIIIISFLSSLLLFFMGIIGRLKRKIIVLKQFRDKEIVDIVNHYNAQIKIFEDRFKIVYNKIGIELPNSEQTDPNIIKNEIENKRQKEVDILFYNKEFSDWGIGDYGLGTKTSIYKDTKYNL